MINERGSTLILVLLISLVFVTAGLTIFSLTISGAKRAEIRKEDVVTTQRAIEEMNLVISDFKKSVRAISLDNLSKAEYRIKLQEIEETLQQKYTNDAVLTIRDHTTEVFGADVHNIFARYYTLSLIYINDENPAQPTITKTIERNVLLSPTPSFLQYAIGSQDALNLNGASEIIGNVYGATVSLANVARYVNQLSNNLTSALPFQKGDTLYPAIQGDLFVDKQLDIYEDVTKFDGNSHVSFNKQLLSRQKPETLAPYFYQKSAPPLIRKPYDPFISIDFKKTVADKLHAMNVGLSLKPEDIPDNSHPERARTIAEQLQDHPGVYTVDQSASSFNFAALAADKNVILLKTNRTEPFLIANDVKLARKQWIIVQGDLELYSNKTPITIEGNLLVLGNLTIRGNALDVGDEKDKIVFNSTIYTTGKTTIYSTDITGTEEGKLVAFSQDDLLISRINEFQRTSDAVEPLEAFFYTDTSAELYGVGSLFKIHGGLFAKQELTINAIRQDTFSSLGGIVNQIVQLPLLSRSLQENKPSRFVVEYDKSVILQQLDALPHVSQLQVLVEDYTITPGKKASSP
jgi:hypothetical protein